jgi:AraC-like DNA-binding protein
MKAIFKSAAAMASRREGPFQDFYLELLTKGMEAGDGAPHLGASSARTRLALRTYLKMLLILLVEQYAHYSGTVEIFQRQQRALDRLRPLFCYLGENCGNPIQVREAARISGMSKSHFMSFFKQVTGLSFINYLNHYRVERAQALLASTNESMASISQEVGFCDQSYFGTVFRKIVGTTPAAYRRRLETNGLHNSTHAPAQPSNSAAEPSMLSIARIRKVHASPLLW